MVSSGTTLSHSSMQGTENNVEMRDCWISFSALCDCANISKSCFEVSGTVWLFLLPKRNTSVMCKAGLHTPVWAVRAWGTGTVKDWLSANSYVKLMNGADYECHLLLLLQQYLHSNSQKYSWGGFGWKSLLLQRNAQITGCKIWGSILREPDCSRGTEGWKTL